MMTRYFKRMVGAALCAIMLTSLFGGCGTGAVDGQTNDNGQTSVKETQPEPTTTTAVESSQAEASPVPERRKVTIYNMKWDTTEYADDALVKTEIEKQIENTINIELDFQQIPAAEYDNKLNIAISSGMPLDGFMHGINKMSGFTSRPGLLKNLNDLINTHGQNIKAVTEQVSWDSVTQNGNIYAIPNYSEAAISSILARKDILDKYGIPVPTTIEEFEKACEMLKAADSNIIPAVGNWWDVECIVSPAFGKQFSTASKAILDSEQRIVPYSVTEGALPFLQTYTKWVQNGWYDRDNQITSGEKVNQMFVTGKSVFKFTAYGDILGLLPMAKEVTPDANIAVIHELNNGGRWSWSGPSNFALYILDQSKAADRLVQYVDWMVADQKNYDLTHYGIEGKHFLPLDGMLRGLPAEYNGDAGKLGYCGAGAGGTFALLTYTQLDRLLNNTAKEYLDARQVALKTKWSTDPLVGKLTLDNSVEAKYPKLKSFEEDWWKTKLLTGALPPNEETIKKHYEAYLKAGGDEVSKEYYKQYKAAGY